jgi:hypothetical protein
MFTSLVIGFLLVCASVVALSLPFFATIRTGSFLRDKIALITGGSRGLGLVIARQICGHGGKVALIAGDSNELARSWKTHILGCQAKSAPRLLKECPAS